MPERITNKAIYDSVQELREDVRRLDTAVRLNTTEIAVLKTRSNEHNCESAAYRTSAKDIAVLQAQTARQNVNWDRVIQLGLAILQAVILAKLFAP